MSVDLHLDWIQTDHDDYFRKVPSAVLTLRDGRSFFAPWVHQYTGTYASFSGRYVARNSGEDIWYTRDGTFYGGNRGMDIVSIERMTHEEACRQGRLNELAG